MSQVTIRGWVLCPVEVTVSRLDYELGATACLLAEGQCLAEEGDLVPELVRIAEERCEECSSARPGSCFCAGAPSDDEDARAYDYATRAREASAA